VSRSRLDAELEELFGDDPGLEQIARALQAGHLKAAPLDSRFKQDLRRKLMGEAYETLGPSRLGWRRLFGMPGFAGLAVAVGAAVIAFFVIPTLLRPPQTVVVQPDIDTARPVALNQPIVLKFNQPMDHASVERSVSIQPATEVSYQWQGNNLVITPAGNQLAGSTQYHVSVAPSAQTSGGKPIGTTAPITFVTAPQPTPPPVASPPPSPAPALAIINESRLANAAGAAAWAPDGSRVYYLNPGGDLVSIGADGSGQQTLLTGHVTAFALAPDGKSYAAVQDGRPIVGQVAGGPPPAPAWKGVDGAGWQGASPIFWSSATTLTFFNADGTKLQTFGGPAHPQLSPDGTKALAGADPVVPSTHLLDLQTGTTKNWNVAALASAWAPDSSKVAYVTDAGAFVAQPDGSSPKQVLSVGGLKAIVWSKNDLLLATGDASGSYVVHADGSAPQRLDTANVGVPQAWSPDGSSVLVARESGLFVLKLGPASNLNLEAGAKIVDAFEAARVARDADKAAGYLTASAARTTGQLIPTGEPHLKRSYTVASELVSDDPPYLRYVVRLVFANAAGTEIRYQDETVKVVSAPRTSQLMIDSINDGPAHDVAGPIVTAVTFAAGTILVYFDSDLDPSTVPGAVRLATPEGKQLTVKSAYAKRIVTLSGDFSGSSRLELTVTTALKDIAGGAAPADYTIEVVNAGAQSG
jgi:hypothetical protein